MSFDLAKSIMTSTPLNGSRIFEGEDLEMYLKEALEENITEQSTFWINKNIVIK
jgi:hypothetical protein